MTKDFFAKTLISAWLINGRRSSCHNYLDVRGCLRRFKCLIVTTTSFEVVFDNNSTQEVDYDTVVYLIPKKRDFEGIAIGFLIVQYQPEFYPIDLFIENLG